MADVQPTGKSFVCAADNGDRYTVNEYRAIFGKNTSGVDQMQGAAVYYIDYPQVDPNLRYVISGSLSDKGMRRFNALAPIGILTQIEED